MTRRIGSVSDAIESCLAGFERASLVVMEFQDAVVFARAQLQSTKYTNAPAEGRSQESMDLRPENVFLT
jgi:hypothetical protein